MKQDKEKLKSLMEENQQKVSQEEVEAVVRIISVMGDQDKAHRLPEDFARKVVGRVVKKQLKENRFGWFGFVLGVIGLIICLVVSLAFVDFKPDLGFLKNISGYTGLFIFGALFILIINFVEKKVFRFSSE